MNEPVKLEDFWSVGSGLRRPECVLAHRSGLLFAPDWTPPGGVSVISARGGFARILANAPREGVEPPVRPNGIMLEPGGSFLLTHLGETAGGVYRLRPNGVCEAVVTTADGAPLPPTNFVAADAAGRLWITVSTRKTPRALDYRPDAATGFIAVAEPGDSDARIVADGLGYTNECLFSPDGRTLYVNETFGRRLTAFDVSGAALSNKRVVADFGPGTFPDGLAWDVEGGLLVTSIVSNRVLRVSPTGDVDTLLEDSDADHLANVEAAFQEGGMGRQHLDQAKSARLANISNLAFGGQDLSTTYFGCLLNDRIEAVRWPIAGAAPRHWTVDLGPLASLAQR